MQRDTTQPAPARAALAAALAAVLAGVCIQGCRSNKAPASRNVRVLRWRADLQAGEIVERPDLDVIVLPGDVVARMDWAVRESKIDGICGRKVVRNVSKGGWVRLADIGEGSAGSAPGSAPAPADPSDRWDHFPVAADPTTMEAGGDVVRYVTETRIADSAELHDYTDPKDRPIGPGDLFESPLVHVGLEKLSGPVPGEAAPPGAHRTHAFRQIVPGGRVDHIGYWTTDKLPDVEAFYTRRMTECGYRLVRRAEGPQGRKGVSLTFYKDAEHQCFVTLRPVDTIEEAAGATVKIILILRRPADKPAR